MYVGTLCTKLYSIFTMRLHVMQHTVYPLATGKLSARLPSVKRWHCDKKKKEVLPTSLYHRKDHSS